MSSPKNFLSGCEGEQHFQAAIDSGAENILMSYLYLSKKNDPDLIKRRKRAYPHINFLIDSGAHTFQAKMSDYAQWKRADFESYCKGYVEWLKQNRAYIFAGVELDIDYCLNMTLAGNSNSTVGTSIVEEWQKNYFMPLEELGLQICYVWHKERKLEGWEDMCRKFPYVGLPGEMSSDNDFNKYMTVARRYCTKVHGFAATKQADFRDWPWFSVDSITWKTAEMYGTLIHWDERKQVLIFDQDKNNRAAYRADFERHGLDAEAIIKDTNYKEVTKYALISMTSMEKFYVRKHSARTAYHERRLPHPTRLEALAPARIAPLWLSFLPKETFKDHAGETKIEKLRQFLIALSAIQYRRIDKLQGNKSRLDFLGAYFPKLIHPAIADIDLLQKEVVAYTAPLNPPALSRTDREHFNPSNNPPKSRSVMELSISDLEHDTSKVPFSSEEI